MKRSSSMYRVFLRVEDISWYDCNVVRYWSAADDWSAEKTREKRGSMAAMIK